MFPGSSSQSHYQSFQFRLSRPDGSLIIPMDLRPFPNIDSTFLCFLESFIFFFSLQFFATFCLVAGLTFFRIIFDEFCYFFVLPAFYCVILVAFLFPICAVLKITTFLGLTALRTALHIILFLFPTRAILVLNLRDLLCPLCTKPLSLAPFSSCSLTAFVYHYVRPRMHGHQQLFNSADEVG